MVELELKINMSFRLLWTIHFFFGKCVLVNQSGDLTIEMWNEFYESVMQFENIEESESEEEEEEDPDGEYSNGYLKDGFVVSDNELEEEPYKN